jgi:hypothetical protein
LLLVTGNIQFHQGNTQVKTSLSALVGNNTIYESSCNSCQGVPFDKPGGSKVVIYKTSTVSGDGDYGVSMVRRFEYHNYNNVRIVLIPTLDVTIILQDH